MEIYLVRHTTPDIDKGICYGQSDVNVTAQFNFEASLILEKMPQGIKAIYTSPLIRCKTLADYVSQFITLPVVQDVRLKELNFGDWEMKRWEDLNQIELMKWMSNYEAERCPGGESYLDLVARVREFYTSIEERHKNESVIVITHAGVIKAFQVVINNLSLSRAMDLKIDYGQIIPVKNAHN